MPSFKDETRNNVPRVAVLSISHEFWDSISANLEDVADVMRICSPAQLEEALGENQGFDLVLVPHWRWRIPKAALTTWRCVGFHTSPLPRGRGGSPIQNQILRGQYESELCAFELSERMDAGDVLIRHQVDLRFGSLGQILTMLASIAADMSRQILLQPPRAIPQEGEPSYFNRLRPEHSQLPSWGLSARQVYDRIRMLDGSGYPKAYVDLGEWRLEFADAELLDGSVSASVTWNPCRPRDPNE